MKLKINKIDLVNALDKVSGAINPKPTLPILSGVLIKVESNNLYVEATNLDLRIESNTVCESEIEGTVVIPAKKFISIIKSLSGSEVSIELKGNTAIIKSNKSKFKIHCQESTDWPVNDLKGDYKLSAINSSTIKNLFKSVMSAVSNDESRAALNGVLIDIEETSIKCVATDGRRIALNEFEFGTGIEIQCIVPLKSISEVIKNISGDVAISIFENCIKFTSSGVTIESKIIEANFPNYANIVPKTTLKEISLNRKNMIESIKRISTVLNNFSEPIKLEFKSGKDLEISAASDANSSNESVMCESSDDVILNFNPMFLIDGLSSSLSDDIILKYNDNVQPCVLTDNKNFTYVIMPMRG
jgi:DNA polymerase III subunit beta